MRFGAAEVDAGAGDAPALARALAPRLEDDAGAWLDEVAEGNYARDEIRAQYLSENEQLIALLPGSRKQ